MATFPKCPNCNNDEEEDEIWNCGDCGCVHCKECDGDDGSCPECSSRNMNLIGSIDPDSGSDDDDDDLPYGSFSECPHCSKNDSGESIWKCVSCGCVHCMSCDPDNGSCPNCGGKARKIGNIE